MPPVARHPACFSRSHSRGFFCEFQRRHVLVGAKKVNEAESPTQRIVEEKDKDVDLTLNPVELGRRSRQAIEEAWFQVTSLATPRASFALDDDLGAGITAADMPPAQAQFTRVLVVGGTGRVGRIVVRKLLLRGYSVRVMCRDMSDEAAQNLPSSAELVKGDVGNIEDCVKATRGVDKIIYCATSTLQMTGDINKVDNVGVSHIARAWMDYKHTSAAKAKAQTKAIKRKIADFKKEADQEKWDLMHVGPLDREVGYHGQDIANALITEDNKRLCFQGSIFSRSGVCEWGGPCGDLQNCEALVARVLGDGKPYLAILEDQEGNTYKYRINTRLGFSTVWMPFNRFRAESTKSPPMRPGMLRTIKFRFDKSLIPADIAREATVEEEQAMRNAFNFEIAYLKAQPQRTEPTLILVSSAASAGQEAASGKATTEMGSFAGSESNVLGSKEGVNARRVSLKRRGEASLRASGVGYCIVRPSALVQEPGGYKALVFDQGDRIQQGIGYADVADVCLRALHASEAVNKTFEVCYENVADDSAMEYELVAHMPDKSNFLKQALDGLERNT